MATEVVLFQVKIPQKLIDQLHTLQDGLQNLLFIMDFVRELWFRSLTVLVLQNHYLYMLIVMILL